MYVKTKLHEDITQLQQATKRGELPREVRLGNVEALVEDYYAKTGEMPDAIALERLSDLCLYEELTDPNPDKMTTEEYPIMSEYQFDRRDNRESSVGDAIDNSAADGRKHLKPTRRSRTDYENRFVDKKAKTRNIDRKREYNAFINGKKDGLFTISVATGEKEVKIADVEGEKRHDFDISFRKAVNALYKSDISMEEKKSTVEEMLERYYSETEEYPSESILEKLADVLLSDVLRDTDVSKIAKTEYPILSEKQISRRTIGIHVRSDFKKMEVPLVEDEVNYHANTMLSTYFVYKSPRVKFGKERKKFKFMYDPNIKPKLKLGGRTESDVRWSKEIKDRDEYCCQNPKCKSRVGIMHAHHIESYVDNPDLRTDLYNGITLCDGCHTNFHSLYGRGGNTRKQLREFFTAL
jgi:hypothetical protein